MTRFHVEVGPCGFCGVGTGNHETRTGCIMALTGRLETSRNNFIEVESQLSAATARASELEKLLAAKWGLNCAECGAQWMHDAAIDELSDLVEARVAKRDAELSALGERVVRAERENEAWRALAKHASETGFAIEPSFHGPDGGWTIDLTEDGEYKSGAYGSQLPRCAIDLATKLGLLQPETKGKL